LQPFGNSQPRLPFVVKVLEPRASLPLEKDLLVLREPQDERSGEILAHGSPMCDVIIQDWYEAYKAKRESWAKISPRVAATT
jgi:hypothetical protein